MNLKLRVDRLIFWLYRNITKHSRWLMPLASGFLLGRITEEISKDGASLGTVWTKVFSVSDRELNWLSWFSLAMLVGLPLAKSYLQSKHRQRRSDVRLARLLNSYKARIIKPYSGIAWGHALSLQSCPEIHRGWLATEIKLYHSRKHFSMPHKFKESYREFISKHRNSQRFSSDTPRVMLTISPKAFTDNLALILNTQNVINSEIQFYREHVSSIGSERDRYIGTAVEGEIHFAHTFSLHLLIVTSDDKVIITKRSAKVSYFPNTWSCSAEEQLGLTDIDKIETDQRVRRWGERLLLEEFGLSSSTYDPINFRILSVFLESDILNMALCGIVTLDIGSAELDQILRGLPRMDYEFTNWEFLKFSQLLDELFSPTRKYHPTSGYRMLMASIHHYGEPRIEENLLRHSAKTIT